MASTTSTNAPTMSTNISNTNYITVYVRYLWLQHMPSEVQNIWGEFCAQSLSHVISIKFLPLKTEPVNPGSKQRRFVRNEEGELIVEESENTLQLVRITKKEDRTECVFKIPVPKDFEEGSDEYELFHTIITPLLSNKEDEHFNILDLSYQTKMYYRDGNVIKDKKTGKPLTKTFHVKMSLFKTRVVTMVPDHKSAE